MRKLLHNSGYLCLLRLNRRFFYSFFNRLIFENLSLLLLPAIAIRFLTFYIRKSKIAPIDNDFSHVILRL